MDALTPIDHEIAADAQHAARVAWEIEVFWHAAFAFLIIGLLITGGRYLLEYLQRRKADKRCAAAELRITSLRHRQRCR